MMTKKYPEFSVINRYFPSMNQNFEPFIVLIQIFPEVKKVRALRTDYFKLKTFRRQCVFS